MKPILLSDQQKIVWIQRLAILGFLAASFYAPQLWVTEKEFPVIPLFDWIYIPTNPMDTILAWGFMILLGFQLFKQSRGLGLLTVGIYTIFCFIDQNRLQPYFYQSILTLLAIHIFPKKSEPKIVLQAVALIFFGTYFWSGIHKINGIFYEQWMHALLKHFSFIPHILLKIFTYMVPHMEWLMGILLLFNKTRKATVISVSVMHLIITGTLFYLGYGFNVVPWNIQNIASVWVLFWTFKTISPLDIFKEKINFGKTVIVIFTVLLPFSNLFGIWDHLISFSFFTSKLNYYYIEINDDQLKENLPEHIQKYYRMHQGKTILYPNEWAGEINKVLFYPEDRIINYLDTYLKSFAENPEKENLTKLVVYNK